MSGLSYDAPDVRNYKIGKGVLYFDRFDADGNGTGERDLGNCPGFSLTNSLETLDHFSSRSGVKSKDKVFDISESVQGTIVLDEFNMDNIALALSSDDPATESQGDGNVGAESFTARHDKWVKLNFRKISHNSEGISGYAKGTDYEMDYDSGRIKVLSTGSMSDATSYNIGYTYEAHTWPTAGSFTRKPVEGLIRFKGDNTYGPDYEVEIWKAKLTLNTDLNLISDEVATIELGIEVLEDSANHPDHPFLKIWGEGSNISES